MHDFENEISDFFGKVSGLRVGLEGLDELVQGRYQEVKPSKVRLEVGLVFAQGQLELLAEVDPLEDQVGQRLDGQERPEQLYTLFSFFHILKHYMAT